MQKSYFFLKNKTPICSHHMTKLVTTMIERKKYSMRNESYEFNHIACIFRKIRKSLRGTNDW